MKMQQTIEDKIFYGFVYTFLTLMVAVILYPLIYVVSASVSDSDAVYSGEMWLWPVRVSFLAYKSVFQSKNIANGYFNTIFYTVVGTAFNLILTFLAAYVLARRDFKARNAIMALFAFTMLFNGGLIPNYLLINDLHLIDTRWALILPAGISVWNLIIMRTYLESSIPMELYEASSIDGCSDFKYMIKIVLPLAKTIFAVEALYYGVYHWNSYFNALIYLKSAKFYPLQIILRNILILFQMDQGMNLDPELVNQMSALAQTIRYSVIVVASLPLLIMYPFLQKYFIKGVMVGSLKG